jgi:hypothetical protein
MLGLQTLDHKAFGMKCKATGCLQQSSKSDCTPYSIHISIQSSKAVANTIDDAVIWEVTPKAYVG